MDPSNLAYRTEEDAAPYVAAPPHLPSDCPASQANSSAHAPSRSRGPAWFWGLGGTLLSIVGFVAMILFDQYNHMLAELRNDLKHFNETTSQFVKKESMRRAWDHLKESNKELAASNAARAQLEQELRANEKTRGDMAGELQRMRERLSYLEGRITGTPDAETAKNKLPK